MFNPFELFDVKFEITEGENTRIQQMQAPQMLIEQQFLQLMQQAANIVTPIKIKMSRTEKIYDAFDNKWLNRENSVTFMNNTYIQQKGQN